MKFITGQFGNGPKGRFETDKVNKAIATPAA